MPHALRLRLIGSEGFDSRLDRDGDGAVALAFGGNDCDDDDATFSPAAEEVWYDGVDQTATARPTMTKTVTDTTPVAAVTATMKTR